MNIADIRIHAVSAERRYTSQKHLSLQHAAADPVVVSHYYIFEVETDDGRVGLGEISVITPDAKLPDGHPMRAAALRDLLLPLLRGHDVYDTARLDELFRRHNVRGKGAAAVDMACLDLQGQAAGQPLYNLLGGRAWPELPVCWVAYFRPAKEMEPEIAEKVQKGFRAFKLKVGRDIDEDVARVKLVRELAGDDAHIKLDANAAWGTADEAIANLKQLEPYRPAAIETPIPQEDLDGMRRIKNGTGIKFMEHGWPAARVLDYLKEGVVDVFKLYAPAYGGLRQAQQVMGMIAAAGKDAYVGSDVEMGVATLAFGHLAAAAPECRIDEWPCDLRGPELLAGDVLAQPVRYVDGTLVLPDGGGLASALDRAKLAELAGDIDGQRRQRVPAPVGA